MPQYDESFILDDNANQRRNKRSYRVSRKGLLPSFNRSTETLGGHGTYVLKNNINNLKKNKDFGSNYTLKENSYNDNILYNKKANKSFPSLLDDPYNHADEKIVFSPNTRDIYAIKNNNYYSFVVGKSLEDLASNGHYSPLKKFNGVPFGNSRGKSLQNLNENIHVPLIAKYYNKNSPGYLTKVISKEAIHQNNGNHYIVNDTADKKSKRLYESNTKLKERAALKLAARFLESGVYRQLGKTRCDGSDDSGFVEEANGIEVGEGGAVGGPIGSGHKPSFRSANKLARRARSFKEDLLERISAMRSPGAPASHSALPSLRSQSPLSPKTRQHKVDELVSNPAKELELLVRQIKFDLRHFCDVIKKKKLEMLPGNGTIVLETITNIHAAIRPFVSPLLADSPSADLESALNRLCALGAELIKFCDESMIAGDDSDSLDTEAIFKIVDDLQKAVEDLSTLALEKLSGGDNTVHAKTNGTVEKEPKNKLHIRPIVDNIRNVTNENQRNSLPDISLTPREREMLEVAGNRLAVRSSHSIESILDTIPTSSNQEPPPKPPIPRRHFDIAPPLPPKRKPNDSLNLSIVDRVSLQSHSSGSLDSMLNVSNDEEIRAIMDRNSTNLDDSIQHQNIIDNIVLANCQTHPNNRLSLESNSTICTTSSTGTQHRHSNEIVLHNLQPTNNSFMNDSLDHQINSHNRFSSESGFVSMGNTRSSDISYTNFSSQNLKSNLSFIDSTPTPIDVPFSLLADFPSDNAHKLLSPNNSGFDISNVPSVMQNMQFSTSNNFFEQNSKSFSSNASTIVSHTSMSSNHVNQMATFDMQKSSTTKLEASVQSFVKTQRNITMENNVSNFSSTTNNFANFSSCQSDVLKTSVNGITSSDTIDCSVPPALPVKTRKQTKSGLQLESLSDGINPIMDDQYIEFRHASSCALHGPDGLLPRPHTLADNSLGQPPPLPLKKKHIMAYMEVFNKNSEVQRHSVHEQHHSANHCMSSLQHLSNATIETTADGQTIFTKNGQAMLGFSQNSQIINGNKCNQQLTQSHTLHQFNLSTNIANTSQNTTSGFPSPSRSPRLVREDSIKSDGSSIASLSTNSSMPQISPCSNISVIPPALPPKRTKLKQTPNHSPAKPPLSPKPPLLQTGTVSPSTPGPLTCGTPLSGRISTSPVPKFQFDPPPISIDDTLLNQDEEHWQQSVNKPGKFPTEDLDLEPVANTTPSPVPRDAEPCSENVESESEHDVMFDMDVTSRLVWKASGEDGPDIRGGHPDGLIVHAIKSTKDFSEAFLTTYRTFVTPLKLIEKLKKRHDYLIQNGQYSKSREVQSLLTRVVVDLTMADLDEELLSLIRNFDYGLVRSGDLQMGKALRVIILEKYKSKQSMIQQQSLGSAWFTTSSRRESVLDHKAEAIAEQMTLLDAELFTRIPAPEALLWAQDQCEERSPNLTRFTEHFNKMSYWARSRILEQEAKDREKYVSKFMKVMKYLRKMNNFNSYLALLSALDSAPIRRLDWQKYIIDGLKEYSILIDSSSSFRAYRQALSDAQPPCIPYIGLVLQDLTFVHIGNSDLLADGNINFSKRWQQFHILENMKRFSKAQYTFKKNEKIIAMFNGFDDVLNEEIMWQISESIKPRGSKKNVS